MSERVDEAKLAEAKELFLDFRSIPDISQITGLKNRTLQYHAQTHWMEERNALQNKFFEYVTENKKHQLVNITNRALTIIEKSLLELSAKESVTVKEARCVTEILEKIDKILKLDEGKATSITTTSAPSTVFELKKRLRIDPFVKMGELEDEETIMDNSSNSTDDGGAIRITTSEQQADS